MKDYEPNPFTGACVKKMKKVPEINWKDIFRLKLNQNKNINGRDVYGEHLMMRGITQSQINTGHAFLIDLIYDIKYMRNFRFLDEVQKIPAICEIIDNVDESEEPNIVEFGCITNLTKYENEEHMKDNYIIKNIEVSEDNYISGLLKSDNLKELIEQKDIPNLNKKEKSNFTLTNYLKMTTFTPDEINNLTFSNNIIINGRLNKKLNTDRIKTELNFAQINEKADCLFNIKQQLKAELNCKLNNFIKGNNNIFNFKSQTIDSGESLIYLGKISEINLIKISNDMAPEIKESDKEKENGTIEKENNEDDKDIEKENDIIDKENKGKDLEKESEINDEENKENKNIKSKDEKIKMVFLLIILIVIIIIVIVFIIIRIKRAYKLEKKEEIKKKNNDFDLGNKYKATYSDTRVKLKKYKP